MTADRLRCGLPTGLACIANFVRHAAAAALLVWAVVPTESVRGQTDDATSNDQATPTAEGRIPNQSYPLDEVFTKISPQLSDRHHNQPSVINGYLLLAGNGVHEFWDISDPYSPVLLSELFSPYRFGDAESHQVSFAKFPDGSLYLVTTSGRGIDLWDIDDVRQPHLLSALELPGINYGDVHRGIWGVFWQGDYIYVGATSHGVYIVDATDPTQPKLVASVPPPEMGSVAPGTLFALGNLLVITTTKKGGAGVVTMDIGDPDQPTLLDFVRPPTGSYIGGFYGKNAHLLNPFRTYDVTTDPSNIRRIGLYKTPASEYMSFGDGHLFLGGLRGGSQGIWKYLITDTDDLRLIGRIPGRDRRWDDQFSVPIGNLIAISDDKNVNGFVSSYLAVHDKDPDTQPPVVEYVNPPDGAADQATSSRIALSFSDQIELASVDGTTLVVRPVGGQALTGKWGYSQTVVTFWPDQLLEADTTYEIVAVAGGITDLVGNAIASEFRSVFRTGTPSPRGLGGIGSLTPVETDRDARFLVDPVSGSHEYIWDFGDGHEGAGTSASHRYDTPGRYAVTLSVVDPDGLDHFEAEAASLSGGVVATDARFPGYTGTGFAYFPDDATGPDVKVRWQIARDSAGDADIHVRYAHKPRPKELELVVNGRTVTTVSLPSTGAWWNWRSVKIEDVALRAGDNTVDLVALNRVGPSIDRLSLSPESPVVVATYSATQVVHRPPTENEPANSSTVIVAADGARAWAVNPDAATVTAVSTGTLDKAFESRVGLTPRSLAQAPDGTIWVVNEGSYDVSILDSSNGAVIDTIDLPYASMTYGIAFAPDGSAAYITLQALGQLLRIDPVSRTIVHSLAMGPDPSGMVPTLRGIAITSDSRRILVTRFVSPGNGGEIYDLAVQGQTVRLVRTIALANDPGPDSREGGRGVPNYISSVAISPDGVHARVPWKKDNIARGIVRDGQALTHDNTVRTGISQVELSSGQENSAARVDFDDDDMAFAAAFSPLGDLVFVAIQGSNSVNILDAYGGNEIAGVGTGLAPQGLVLDDQGRLYVQNFMSRSLSVFDVTDLLAGTKTSAGLLAEISLVGHETLPDEVLLGKQIFYNAASDRMSLEGYMSCASCHLDGGHDGRTWDFTDRGEGLRNTTSLRGRGGTLLHGPVHWTGNFDEIQDFENNIRSHFGGTGFMRDDDFNNGTRSDPLGAPKAGLSAELDALTAFVSSLTSVPLSPYRNADGSLTEEGERGKVLFVNESCGTCHSGPGFTDSALGVLHDVGTIRAASGGRLGRSLSGFDTPTLKGVWATAPYLHDVSAPTLAQAINAHSGVSLSGSELGELVSYLQQLDELAVAPDGLWSDATLRGLDLSELDIGTFDPATTVYEATAAESVAATTVTAMPTSSSASVMIESADGSTSGHTRDIALNYGTNTITVTVRAPDGLTTLTYTVTVTRAPRPEVSIAAVSSPVAEGEAVEFEVTLSEAALEALTVAVSVTETGSMLAGAPPASVIVPQGATSATLGVPTALDTVVEADSVVTASVAAGTGYTVGTESSATVRVEDDDEAAFTVSAAPLTIEEGESATLTVEITSGVTFGEDQPVDLSVTGTASAADYSLTPSSLTLAAGASSVSVVLAALDDQEEEADETVTVAASHRGIALGSATVTIESVSHDATLSALGLSGIDIGTFASGTTAYTASVPNATTSATVTAAASHAEATVSISPGAEVSLAAGENIITVTVTAEDGTTKKTYTVTVTRLSLPVVSIAAGTSPVTEGTAASFTVTLDQAAPEALTVVVSVAESGSVLSGTPPAAVTFAKGQTSATLSVATASLTAGDGYAVGSGSSATVRVEDDDEAAFTVSAAPLTIKEGASATLTVEITSGVTFGEDQPVDLSVTGTASAADYSLTPSSLTLAAGASSVSVVLAALDDQEEEADETVTVAASHRGIALGSATVTIESVSHDATLSGLSLSGIDIGTFASGTTAYTASVPSATTSTTVTAAARHAEATVSISPGAEVSLAAGENVITVTVTAQDGTTQKTYTVTVTRMSLPVVSIAAVQQRVSEAELARFTVSRTGPTTEALDVQVLFASTTSETVQTLTVRIGPGESSVTRRVQGGDNTIVEDDVTVTWTLVEGEGYAVSAEHASASVVLEENDVPEFAVSVEPGEIAEGESATVTVAITNGVTFRQPETIALSVSGTASASDYAGLPATLTLRAFGTAASFSATATLTAAVDHEDEEAETVAITASHNGSVIGSAAVTINSVSQDAALSSLSLSGVDIGTFSAETTNYAASVGNSVETTRVTATASHAEASVAISPGSEVSLAEGNNTITVTVTAGDGTTTRIYTVTVTRASLPVVSIAAVASRVSEGERAVFRASLTEPAAETLRVGIRWTRSDQSQSITQQLVFHAGMSSKTPSFSKSDDKVVREDLTVTITLQDGAGYRVSEDARSAQVVLEENDAAEFALAVDPASVAEGETAQVQVRITNGVTFAAGQTIALGFVGGTAAKGTDYTVSAESLTLRAGRRRVTASVTAIADSEQEDAETVTVEASHGGEVIGTATLTITGSDSKPEASGKGFSLAPENGSPSGIWSDGETAWVADLADARLYAYRREDGERQPQKDIATEPSPMGLWSDGETLWVAQLGGGLQAHRLSDGARLAGLDLALEQNAAPTGVWSDGETAWVAEWLGDAVHAYQLSDGQRKPGRDIQLAAGNLMPAGLWSDGQTLWVTDWRERVYAYRLADGSRDGRRDIEVSAGDTDPTGLWSSGEVLLATGWESGEVRAYRLPEVAESTPAMKRSGGPVARAVSLPAIVDPALRVAVGAALSKAPGEAVSPQDLAGLEELTARNAGIRDLSGLEQAHSLKELDLGFNPLVDLRPLADLPALESLNLDGAVTDLQALVPLARLQRLSLRSNGIEDLWPLAGLVALSELDLGDNRIADLQPLAGMGSLAVLRADRNRIADLWPLASLAGLEALDLGANRVQDLQPLAGMGRLEALRIAGNRLTELHPLSGMKALADLGLAGNAVTELGALSDLTGLLRLDLRGNPLGDLRPLRALRSLVWVHVGGSRIDDLTPLDGLDGLTVAGRNDLEAPSRGEARAQ